MEQPSPSWPPWFAIVGFLGAFACTLVAVVLVGLVVGADPEDDLPALTVVATLIQGAFFVGVALVLARSIAPPRAWHFGLRRAPFWRALGWAVLGMLAFYVIAAVYASLIDPNADQDVTESLGAEDGLVGLIAAGTMVIVVAPFVEEVFFRGFFYRALRTRYSIAFAALLDGLVFGMIHFTFDGVDGLLLLPPLALLGVIFCLVYERTGTLYAVIGMHAVNNTVAFAVTTDAEGGWRVAIVAGPLMVLACAIVPRLLPDGPPPLPPRPIQPDTQLSLPIE